MVSFDFSNILEILRWDILSKEFAKLLEHKGDVDEIYES